MKITCSKCGGFMEIEKLYKQRYCRSCHAEYVRERRAKIPGTIEDKIKQSARVIANNHQRYGHLKQQPCSVCGHTPAEKHHEDYNKPLDITWLCRPCHKSLHRQPDYKAIQPIVKQLGYL